MAIPAALNTPGTELVKSQAADRTAPTQAAAAPAEPEPPKLVASDLSLVDVPNNPSPDYGREYSQLITFNSNRPKPQIAVGFNSIDLDWRHVRGIVFPTEISRDAFRLNFNASADDSTHGVDAKNGDSDTVMRGGRATWLRALPEDVNVQAGRWSMGNAYPKGKQLPVDNKATIKFSKAFKEPPKVVLWLCCMDFSKSYNWRVKADVESVDREKFTINAGSWGDSILYKTDFCWIAHADVQGIQSGTFRYMITFLSLPLFSSLGDQCEEHSG